MLDNTGFMCGWIAGKYDGRIGRMFSPPRWYTPAGVIPYVLDNGAYGAWTNQSEWDEGAFYCMLAKADECGEDPLWVVVPDVVADSDATLEKWNEHAPRISRFGFPLAFAVQDGMQPNDVPRNADVIFVGGTTKWKWRNLKMWCEEFPRVHVGRVNSNRLLWMADKAGAESCDGTGWFRREPERLEELTLYLDGHHPQLEMGITS